MSADNTKRYVYIPKSSSGDVLKSSDNIEYIISEYGEPLTKEVPLSSSISIYNLPDASEIAPENLISSRLKIHALKNTLDRHCFLSEHYKTTSVLGDKLSQKLTIISIPSIFYGSSIEKGSIKLSINYNGLNMATLQDHKSNGELIEVVGTNTGSVAGVVLYDHGFMILTGSWDEEAYGSAWNSFGTSSSEISENISFDIDFNGTNEINTLTMLLHAEKGEINYSNNPTYIKYGQNKTPSCSNKGYKENDKLEIKNVTKYKYDNFIGEYEKEVFITKIGIYDESKKLIAVAKLAKPVRKTINRDFTFKIKIDI